MKKRSGDVPNNGSGLKGYGKSPDYGGKRKSRADWIWITLLGIIVIIVLCAPSTYLTISPK